MLDLTWEYGRLVVNSENANQSFGSLHRVWRSAFKDAGVKDLQPRNALILGFGAGSAAHILVHELDLLTRITGVDDDEAMLRLASDHFPLKNKELVTLVREDAFTFATRSKDRFDLIVVDLFVDLDLPAGVEDKKFLHTLRMRLTDKGILLMNSIAYDEPSAERSARLRDELRLLFNKVQEQHYEGQNRVYIAM